MYSRNREVVLVKILCQTAEARDGSSTFIGSHNDSLRTRGVSWNQCNLKARKKNPVSINDFEVYVPEKPRNIEAGEVRMGMTCGSQLPFLNEFWAMVEKMEESCVVKMRMGKDHCVYFLDSKPEPTEVLLQGCHIFDGGALPRS